MQAKVVHVEGGEKYDPLQPEIKALAGKWEVVQKRNCHKSAGAANLEKEQVAIGVTRTDRQLHVNYIISQFKKSGMRDDKDCLNGVITRGGAQRTNTLPGGNVKRHSASFVAP
ncbi:hypothetical protein OIU76_026532 [Salix suchowensis]|nr:hypothetical protein OIU76_026532 [Salix suchowensis]